MRAASGRAGAPPPAQGGLSPVERDYQFLLASLERRRELADRYEMDKVDGRTGLEQAEAVAARIGLKLPVTSSPEPPSPKE